MGRPDFEKGTEASGGLNRVDKDDYLSAVQRSVVKDLEIKVLLKKGLTDQIDDRALFMIGIDVSYYYEGYSEFKTEEL